MVVQLNRFMALFALCGLLTLPAMAAPSLAASDDSLSAQTGAMEISPQATIEDSVSTPESHLLNSVFMGDPFRSALANSDSMEHVERLPTQAESMDDMGSGKRVSQKLISGAIVGVVVGGTGGLAGVGVGLAIEDCSDCPHGHNCDLCGIGAALTALFGGTVGYLVGTAIGVSGVDPHDRFIASLGGSVVGLIGGIGLTSASPGVLWPSLLVGPVVGATLASELWRKPPQDSQNSHVSLSLGPTPNGGLSAVAQLRF